MALVTGWHDLHFKLQQLRLVLTSLPAILDVVVAGVDLSTLATCAYSTSAVPAGAALVAHPACIKALSATTARHDARQI